MTIPRGSGNDGKDLTLVRMFPKKNKVICRVKAKLVTCYNSPVNIFEATVYSVL